MSPAKLHRAPASAVSCALASLLGLLPAAALAEEETYHFTGLATVGARDGGPPVHRFSGTLVFDDDTVATTFYLNNSVVQGFRSTYSDAVRHLGITLDNGESVEASAGWLQINSIQEAEAGSPVPAGLSLQVWTTGAAGSINGLAVHNLYLAFLPVPPQFTWDGLDGALGGPAEQWLQGNPALLPGTVDPQITGTAIPDRLDQTFFNGLFLGTNHGLTNTVNPVDSFSRAAAPVPEPGSLALLLSGGGMLLSVLRRDRRR